jgi:hypothetical protein
MLFAPCGPGRYGNCFPPRGRLKSALACNASPPVDFAPLMAVNHPRGLFVRSDRARQQRRSRFISTPVSPSEVGCHMLRSSLPSRGRRRGPVRPRSLKIGEGLGGDSPTWPLAAGPANVDRRQRASSDQCQHALDVNGESLGDVGRGQVRNSRARMESVNRHGQLPFSRRPALRQRWHSAAPSAVRARVGRACGLPVHSVRRFVRSRRVAPAAAKAANC